MKLAYIGLGNLGEHIAMNLVKAGHEVAVFDLDEETGNLVKFQQYYTASSQIIKAAQETFTTLINSL